ncbi:MAG: hypothetical protein DME02_24365 [Candidatus Rokuibacteriota bacterium]|nr:MAG: hypothetical protein DME02_24365 [Candidatus Rokubacteria bacterium]
MSDRSVFYGWWVVAAFSVTTFISTGIRHAVGPFLKPIVADLHLDRASFSLVIALSLFLYGLFMPVAGMLLDRFSVRVVSALGTLVLVASLVMTAMVHNVWEFALVYGVLVPLGLAGTGPVIAAGIVARWFNKRRGTALSVLGSASMTGMSLLVPAVTWLIINTGWRITYVVIAAGVLLLVLPLCVFVVRDSPESMGLRPDGAPAKASGRAVARERVSAGEALQTLAFWQLAGSFFTCGFSMALLSAHGVPMLTDHGYTPMFASWALGVLGGSSIGFTVMLGALSDRFGRRPVGGHGLDDLRAHRGYLRPLFRQLGVRPDLPRAPDGLGARLLARRRAVRADGRLRRRVRAGVRLPRRRRRRRLQHRQGRAPHLERGHGVRHRLTARAAPPYRAGRPPVHRAKRRVEPADARESRGECHRGHRQRRFV